MKVDEKDPGQTGSKPTQAFTDELRQARSVPASRRTARASRPTGHTRALAPLRPPMARTVLATGQRVLGTPVVLTPELRKVRSQQDAQHQVLTSERGEALGRQESDALARVKDLVRRELIEAPAAFDPAPVRSLPERSDALGLERGSPEGGEASRLAGTATAEPDGSRQELDARVDSLLALAERIERMLKTQRPQLAVQVGGSLQAQVLIERTGRGEVALTVQGRSSPPAEPQLEAVREALGARGLRLSALRTA